MDRQKPASNVESVMQDRKLIILADGGLGNRLSGLTSGLATARKLDLPVTISWPANNWCGCYFSDLFAVPDLNVDDRNVFAVFEQHQNDSFLIHENQTGMNLQHVFDHSQSSLNLLATIDKNIVYYHNKVPPYHSEAEIIYELAQLPVAGQVMQLVETFCNTHRIDSSVAGLHLRKTENFNLDESTWYQQVLATPQQRYFVCSDDQLTQDKFVRLPNVVAFAKTSYVDKIIPGDWYENVKDSDGRPTKYNINRSRQSVIEAFVDMLILSRCWIRPTVKSTFSKFARYFAQI